ncbi:PaaX family transcriptional regulator [Alicyclobacillus vulcanalis]|uniref:Transcriptional regulator, PaaX family n=1 Tax=Alicyclobacillus vulcanalis TaxID=252246 RepID=A0A1N7LL86_9BACL|nr:PaaX family transcriptional regulator C-terminal domain-containing protein [Alicyclobacillus vulcanalis]SIS74549.1 transcriptional regulator, PaaX family [Alicyclobacillus vulcanalis]
MRPASLCFTIFGDNFRDLNVKVWVGSLIRYLGALGVTENAARVTFSRMVQQGLLEVFRNGQKSYYALSEQGKRRILDGVRRVYNWEEPRWDREWQVVVCNVSQLERETRERLRHELEWMGFGSLGRDLWVSPHKRYNALRQMLEEYGLTNRVHVFTALYEGPQFMQDVVHQAWDMEDVARRYDAFVVEFSSRHQMFHQKMVMGELTAEEAFVERTQLVHEFRKFLFIDPRLPTELLPPDWIGNEARQLFRRHHEFLSPLAERYFYEHLELLD